MSRDPAPPQIPGLTYLQRLGAGGYADVFLYEQAMPARKVAVKVLRESGLSKGVLQRFRVEANAMAQLEHPNIVPVYATGTTSDGRPFIVMMYFPRASLSERVKKERLGVAETLRIGIQLGSAIETAHRAGLLHRDIKPANVLTSAYGNPGLTDFGIAADVAQADDEDTGVSVPWSPPEILYATAPASVRSDVYSLAATLWHLLVGRSPFEVAGGDNTHFALMKRIRDVPAPGTGRPDVPTGLDRLLRTAMAKEVAVRPASALEFARSLQAIEQELRLPRTEIALAAEEGSTLGSRNAMLGGDATRVKGPQRVLAQPAADHDAGDATFRRAPVLNVIPGVTTDEATIHRPPTSLEGPDQPDEPIRRPWLPWVVFGLVLITVISIAWVLVQGPRSLPRPTASQSVSQPPPDVGSELPPGELVFTASRAEGKVTFAWTYANALPSDDYYYKLTETGAAKTTTRRSLVVDAPRSGPVCVWVRVHRQSGNHGNSDYDKGCQG